MRYIFCIIILIITWLLSKLIKHCLKRYPENFIKNLLPKNVVLQTDTGLTPDTPISTLNHGDIIVLSSGDIVPLDCILLEDTATFEPAAMFATLRNTTFYTGDEVQGGLRLTSTCAVRLKVACAPVESTFIRYTSMYLNTVAPFLTFNAVRSLGYFCSTITTCFKKGILINNPQSIRNLLNTRIAIFTKEALLKTKKCKLTGIYPKDNSITPDKLLEYAARAELPYDTSYIGHAILTAYKQFSFLSDVKSTAKYPDMGIKTTNDNDTILAGNKLLMISQNIKGLPNFEKLEDGISIKDTYIYIAVNDRYLGYLHLTTPIRDKVADIIRFLGRQKIHTVIMTADNASLDSIYDLTHKKYRFHDIYTNQATDKKQANLLMLKQKLKLKKNDGILYFDTSQNDTTLTDICDYHVIMGPILLNQDISLADAAILSGNYIHFTESFKLLKKARKAAITHTFIIIFFTFLVFSLAICLPEVYLWHAVAADCIMYLLLNTYSALPNK